MVSYRRPEGTRDFLPDDMAIRNYVEGVIREVFESYGFQQIQTPIFEEFALLAARSGDEIREEMFTFVSPDDVEYALRPELTAPVCRLVSTGALASLPKPYKVYYIGQCFRYGRPQAGRYREFMQAGLELMGSSSPIADAEVITVAARVIERLGISAFKLKVGNIGIFRDILAAQGFDYDAQSGIIGDIDRIMSLKEKCYAIRERAAAAGAFETDDVVYVETKVGDLYDLQQDIEYEGKYEIVERFEEDKVAAWLERLPVIAEATYKAAWLAKGKISEEDLADLLIQISRIQGTRDEIDEVARELLRGTDAEEALEELFEVVDWLDTFGVSGYEVVLGVARGLDFYTGTVFEFDSPLLGAQKQICGGGRYDRLVAEFRGPETPATGFAFGLDRLTDVFVKSGGQSPGRKSDILVVTISDDLKPKAIEISERLRQAGKKVEVDLLERDLKGQLGYASTVNCNYAVIIGPDELAQDSVTLRNMATRKQESIKIADLEAALG